MDNQRLICSWDFRTLAAFPENCASRGCILGPSGLELSGPKAYITLPVTLPSNVPSLRDRSLAVCIRFTDSGEQPPTGHIAIGLDDDNKPQHERLVFGAVSADYDHFPYWKVDRKGQFQPRRFGFRGGTMENSVNEDIHLALVVQKDTRQTSFRCYRNGQAYGRPTVCSNAAVFHGDDQFAVVIKRPGGSGTTVIRYAQVFGEALPEGEILRLAQVGLSTSGVPSQTPSQADDIDRSSVGPAAKGGLDQKGQQDGGQPSVQPSDLPPATRSSLGALSDQQSPVYCGEDDGGPANSDSDSAPTSRHSFVVVWEGQASDWPESRIRVLEQCLLSARVDLVAVGGCFARPAPSAQVFIKGHFVTQELKFLEQKALVILQEELSPQLVRFEISEAEGNGVSLGPLLDQRLNISELPEVSRRPFGGPAEVGKDVAEAACVEPYKGKVGTEPDVPHGNKQLGTVNVRPTLDPAVPVPLGEEKGRVQKAASMFPSFAAYTVQLKGMYPGLGIDVSSQEVRFADCFNKMRPKFVELHPIVANFIKILNETIGHDVPRRKAIKQPNTVPPFFPGPNKVYAERFQSMTLLQLIDVIRAICDFIHAEQWGPKDVTHCRDALVEAAWDPVNSHVGTWAGLNCCFEALEKKALLAGYEDRGKEGLEKARLNPDWRAVGSAEVWGRREDDKKPKDPRKGLNMEEQQEKRGKAMSAWGDPQAEAAEADAITSVHVDFGTRDSNRSCQEAFYVSDSNLGHSESGSEEGMFEWDEGPVEQLPVPGEEFAALERKMQALSLWPEPDDTFDP